MLEFEELKLKLQGFYHELCDLKDAIDYDAVKKNIVELENLAATDGFWDDIENSQKGLIHLPESRRIMLASQSLRDKLFSIAYSRSWVAYIFSLTTHSFVTAEISIRLFLGKWE